METATPAVPAAAPAASTPPAPATATSTPAPAAAVTPDATPKPPEPKRYKAKVYGKDVDIDGSALDSVAQAMGLKPEELLTASQIRAAGQKALEEASRLRKEAEEFKAQQGKRFQDPRVKALAQQYGVDEERALAILQVQELMQQEQMSPDQRALADERKKREELEAKLKGEEEAKAAQAQEAEMRVHIDRFNREIPAIADKLGLPKTPRVGSLVVDHMLRQAKAGTEPDANWAAQYALETVRTETKGLLSDMSDDQLAAFLGDEVTKRIVKRTIAKVQNRPASPVPAPPPAPEKPANPYLSVAEWRKQFGGG
jgi:hypothetical protein